MISPKEAEAKKIAIQERILIAREEEKYHRLSNPLSPVPIIPNMAEVDEQGRKIFVITENAQNKIKEIIKDEPTDKQKEIEIYTNKVIAGKFDKELGIGKYTVPGIDNDIERGKEIEQPNIDLTPEDDI